MSRKTRKLIWSAPLVAVLAVAGALAMFAAQGTGSVFANPLPGAPMNLEVEAADGDAGRTTLVLTWDAAANASGYRIDKVDGSGAIWESLVTEDAPHTGTTYTDVLTASDTRWYRVFAVNSHGVGPVSNAASGTTDDKVNPGPVMNLRATPNEKSPRKRLDLSWDAPADNGGEMIVGYEIQAHIGGDWAALDQLGESSPTHGAVTVTTKTSYMDTHDKDPGDSQLYRVRAINGTTKLMDMPTAPIAAAGDASKEWRQIRSTTQTATDPGQVTHLTAVNSGADQIDLYWYDPEDTGGWAISGYVIQAHRQGKMFPSAPNAAAIKAATFGTSGPTLGDADNLDNAIWYQTKGAAGVTQASFTGILGRDDTDDDTSNPVQQRWYFRVYAVTTDDGPNDDTDATDDVFRRSSIPSNTASDVPAAREIDHDRDGTTNTLDPLAAPSLAATSPTNDGKERQIDLSVTVATALTAATPDVEQIAYRIDYSENAGLSWKLLERDTRFTGFGPDRDYEDDDDSLGYDDSRSYRVFAIGRHPFTDVGPSSAMATGATAPSTVPDKPTGVTAASPSLRSIEASWTAPEDNGGQPITKYLVQWAPDDGDSVPEDQDFDDTANTNAEAADIDDDATDDAMAMGTFDLVVANTLDDDTVYVFRVAGVNELSGTERPASVTTTGDFAPKWSDPVLFNTTDALKPGMVEGLTSEEATDRSGSSIPGVNLLWNKPSGNVAIVNYDIQVQNAQGDWVNPLGGENWPATRTIYTDPDEPEADEVRRYRVRASNEAGDGDWTGVRYPRNPATHMHVAASGTIPAQTVTVDTTATVNASTYFSDNAGATYAAESDDTAVATVVVTGSTVSITGVAEGTATITVTATSGGVKATQTIAVTVTAAALGAPTNVMATVDDSDPGKPNVTVTWTDGANADVHHVYLLDLSDWRSLRSERIPGSPSQMTHTFTNVDPGNYLAIVVSTLGEDYDYNYQAVAVE